MSRLRAVPADALYRPRRWIAIVAGVCGLALVITLAGTTSAQERAPAQERAADRTTVPEFSGYWTHNNSHFSQPEEGPGPVTHLPGLRHLYQQDLRQGVVEGTRLWLGDASNPILQPWAAEVIKAHNEDEIANNESGWQALQLCRLVGVPHILLLREPLVFLQEPDMVTMLYQRDHQMRRVYLDQEHPANIEPSRYGHSVGHYEGGTLVIDTVAMIAEENIDYYGTPQTDQIHVVERYRVIDDGQTLEVRFTVDDPGTFTMEWSAVQRYRRVEREVLEEIRCAENPRDMEGDEYPIPIDNTPDF